MARYQKLTLLLFSSLLLAVLIVVVPAVNSDPLDETVFAKVYSGKDSYIEDFSPGSPSGSVVLSAQTLPNKVQPNSVGISPDGNWLFARAVPNSNGFSSMLASRAARPFVNSLNLPSWASLSADSQYMFYLDVDDSGHYETFNFLHLSTGAVNQFIVAPLVPAVNPSNPPFKLPVYASPIGKWTLNSQPVPFFSCRASSCFSGDLLDFFTLDFSSYDMTRYGSWQLPKKVVLNRASHKTDFGIVSPNGAEIAYSYIPDRELASIGVGGDTVAIQNITTGQISSVAADAGMQISGLAWNNDGSTLYYFQQLPPGGQQQIYQYDLETQQSSRIFPALNGVYARSTVFCGNTMFYVQSSVRQNTLYRVNVSGAGAAQAVFTADQIELLTCGSPYAWSPEKVGICNPFCTPTPSIPVVDNIDVQAVDLSGGDVANGQQLYNNVLDCGACHNFGTIGPRTQGMYTVIVSSRLVNPRNADMTAEQYIAASILNPNAYIVGGYSAGIMPKTFGKQMTISDLRDVIAYIKTQR